jgi:hypothetical protein
MNESPSLSVMGAYRKNLAKEDKFSVYDHNYGGKHLCNLPAEVNEAI